MYTLRTFKMKLQSFKTRTRDILFLANRWMCLVGSFAASDVLSSTMKLSYIYIGLQNELL